jgi:spore coat protein U-like protein
MRKSGGGDLLSYNLFTDSALTQVWGDGATGGSVLTQKVTKNKAWNAIVYGSLPAQQNVSAGSYSDSLLVTIIW